MAGEKKSQKGGAPNDTEWGDSFSVSKKAMKELAEINENKEQEETEETETKKKTTSLREYSNYSAPAKKTAKVIKNTTEKKAAPSEAKNELNQQLDNVNTEINKAITEIESTLEKFFSQIVTELKNFFLAIYNLFLKFILLVFISPLKNAGKFSIMFLELVNKSIEDFNDYLSGPNKKKQEKEVKKGKTTNLKESAAPEKPAEKPKNIYLEGIVFSELAQKGIVFLNIKNNELYDPSVTMLTDQAEEELMKRALKEVNDCARLAKSLPSPTKGRYIGQDMEEILKNAQIGDLKLFLQYVYTHPKPFMERSLRLSEAFATWAHKGAPV
ncbi:MAG: hypothetical protein U0457_15975 [Candidatus Sericytochromatia bacterium]